MTISSQRFQVSGVRCQGRKSKKLKLETSVFEIWDFINSSTPSQLSIFAGRAIEL
jgi:L-cysteine desulfidase